MIRRRCVFVLVAAVAALLGGCAGSRVQAPPRTKLEAMEHNRRGVDAQARGDREQALAEFRAALKLQTSIDNTEGMIVALVNSARTERLKGDVAAAREDVERAASLLPEGSELAAELFYEKAKVISAAGDFESAVEWALKSEAAEKGDEVGRRKNLVASLLVRRKLLDRAQDQAEKALEANRKTGSAAEEANSLRILADIRLAQGAVEKAGGYYRQALVIDKELALGPKIASDIVGLADVAVKAGDGAGAAKLYRRAADVSVSGGDNAAAAAALERLAQLYRLQGEGGSAQRADDERKKLLAGGKR